jgi:hypothetical protein
MVPIALITEPVFAFQLTGKTASSSQETYVTIPDTGDSGKITVTTKDIKEIKRGGSDALLDLLRPYQQQGWKFKQGGNLGGAFNVISYYPCAPITQCGKEMSIFPELGIPPSGKQMGVGATIWIDYEADPNDEPKFGQTYWIQRVNVNTGGQPVSAYGMTATSFNLIDNLSSNTPFYLAADYLGRFNPQTKLPSYSFLDVPYVLGTNSNPSYIYNHDWNFELYLAYLRPNQEVTIYNGISWGWTNTFTRPKTTKKFSDSLASGFEVDRFNLSDLTPGSKYIAWTNNDLPSNRCNPNTFLSTDNDSGFRLGFDDNSSPVGNGFASALTGTVGSSGNINLNVRAAGGGARGQDRGNYELFVDVYEPQDSPDFSVATSGGGGFGKEKRGLTQQNPILPNSIQNGWQVFNKVPGCRWFDPPTTYGFEFQSLENTLFTEILDFPAGDDQEFTVAVGDSILGNFSPGDKLDFVSLLGYPVDNFRITGIDSLFGETAETAFPIQLAFQEREGSFKMRQISQPIDAEAVPEPGSILATKGMVLWFAAMRHILRKKRQAG